MIICAIKNSEAEEFKVGKHIN